MAFIDVCCVCDDGVDVDDDVVVVGIGVDCDCDCDCDCDSPVRKKEVFLKETIDELLLLSTSFDKVLRFSFSLWTPMDACDWDADDEGRTEEEDIEFDNTEKLLRFLSEPILLLKRRGELVEVLIHWPLSALDSSTILLSSSLPLEELVSMYGRLSFLLTL